MKKDNFPVKLRKKPTKTGFSLYLEYNANGKTEKKYLGLHLMNGTTPKIKAYNTNVMEQAKAEQAKAVLVVTAKTEKGIAKAKKMTLADLCKEYVNEKKRTGKTNGTIENIETMCERVADFCNGRKIYVANIDVKFCEDFALSLRTAKAYNATEKTKAKYGKFTDKVISTSTQKKIYINFASLMRYAVRKGYLNKLPTEQMHEDYKIQAEEAQRGYLTIEEVKRMEQAQCPNNEIKRAFLFACYCGLRISDIIALQASEVQEINGKKYVIKEAMQKTQTRVEIPLNAKALYWLGEPNAKGKFFTLPNRGNHTTIGANVAKLSKNAKIEKHVTFHTSRHTFATTLLTLGGDIYTTSKLLGHKNVTTTQIYADIVNKKKEEAVNLFDNI